MNSLTKVIRMILDVLMTIILIAGIAFIVLFFIGIEPFVVVSGSMEPTIETGSLSFVNKHAKYENIKVNDVIAYEAITGDKVTHRVVSITDEGIETKGDRNSTTDGISTTKSNYIGKNIFSIPKIGYCVKLMQTPVGKTITITIIIILLISSFFMDDNKGKRVKKE